MSQPEVLIYVRFAPDGLVTDIGERPQAATAQGWFDYLSAQVGESFQPLSGGRGLFHVDRELIDRFQATFANV